ncbi:acetyltransferase, N-acetylglutamate synthase [Saccharomonospora marina XMU15]|uniref:Acetyltransferase, N-acetylglutamate synthase n=1 Tax=Saccharomonospora marina XMU15 TaxID=882083 RepID=H5WXS7_9PSEU|nr:GNAT family N-acetyltransferase [Saccharomonospora marina]EHR51736.1 acetyltransferase, N-acetylglutamate synthase [Saccharomonospora marina XMU15]
MSHIRRIGRPGDLGWIVQAHGELYAAEYGFDGTFEALVARIVADFANDHDPVREAGWIAEVDGRRAGCILCVAGADAVTAKLRILLVDPVARGRGVGARLVDTCLAFAREGGYRRVTLWTNDNLVSARKLYRSRGFELVEQEPHRSFGRELVGQYWALDLDRATERG